MNYNDQEVSGILGKPQSEISSMDLSLRRDILLKNRKEKLRNLIQIYYQERGWNENGIPKIDTLKEIRLWDFLNEETKAEIAVLASS